MMRFLIAGAVNTLFGFVVYSVAILAAAAVWLALLVATFAGMAFNFVTTGGYVFKDLSLKRLPRFLGAYLIIYLANLGLITLLSTWVSDVILAQAIVTLPMALGSYLLMARYVFRQSR